MSHGVMCFWFVLNFRFFSASFDILALFSIPCVFSSVRQADENPYERKNISIGGSEQHGDALLELMQDRLG